MVCRMSCSLYVVVCRALIHARCPMPDVYLFEHVHNKKHATCKPRNTQHEKCIETFFVRFLHLRASGHCRYCYYSTPLRIYCRWPVTRFREPTSTCRRRCNTAAACCTSGDMIFLWCQRRHMKTTVLPPYQGTLLFQTAHHFLVILKA